ncbi:LAQU0S02e08438g1_1 [Lachancea quebecensis]|uniref:LAQU0S02e08438g1_1 n=1 Tax=Lachancea quebecensis TaxID=1654605 RepID=A0A0P1KNM8_9SACH|nr:LAQU0S02e08438g1_1 [Lachancea quebecensis]
MSSQAQDPEQVSRAVDALARSILAKRIEEHKSKSGRMRQLELLKQHFDALMLAHQAQQEPEPHAPLLDAAQLDQELKQGLEVVEREGRSYVLLPLAAKPKAAPATTPAAGAASAAPKHTKKKKNKILCSYCREAGHVRARCEKRLLGDGGGL